jgi:Arc/MetJ-type ribon-helix-helix transcriptional regulator
MAATKVVITIDSELLTQLDRLIAQQLFPNRSKAIQVALEEKLTWLRCGRLARESAKLDPKVEKALADEGMEQELAEWSEY